MENKYTLNLISDISFVETNLLIIKTLKGRIQLKGDNISYVISEIIGEFEKPRSIEDVVSSLSEKYNENSLRTLIDYLVQVKILIDETANEIVKDYDSDFIDKTIYYTLGRNSLKDMVDQVTPKRIGIVGTRHISECLLNALINSRLLTNFHIGITEKGLEDIKVADGTQIQVTNYQLNENSETMELLVENSDFIIVASNYRNHYLFKLLNKLCIKMNKKWIRVMIDGDVSEVGPLFIPNESSCYSCLSHRENGNKTVERYRFDSFLEEKDSQEVLEEKSLGLYSAYHINLLASAIACSEIMKFLTGLKCNLIDQVMRIDGIDFEIQSDTIFKYHLCSDCSKGW